MRSAVPMTRSPPIASRSRPSLKFSSPISTWALLWSKPASPMLNSSYGPRPSSSPMRMLRKGKPVPAIVELQEALKLAPNDSGVQRDLADLYSDAKKYDLAETQFRSLLTAQPNDGELHHGLGRVLLKQKKFPEAEKELLAAIQ